ncbi:MAG: 4Fe-4S dicluster domain-containing protein [Candidatus Nezhaarchaeota archaeon]|nr:4Fe-4S dicluster domain-containing protein [Candidatus Nezhaarchaeota archaeon]MCX8142493.1 4Fe-4S dicluster domain-containing protein [Candidatus Nezhaarchaeota archaeon]
MQCGSCTSACVVSRITKSFNPRLIVYSIKQDVPVDGSDIWLCLRCHTCEARCPNSVKIPEIIGELRERVLEERGERRIVELYMDLAETIFNEGVIVPPVSNEVKEFKAESELNIPKLSEEFKDELKAFMKAISFEDRLRRVMSIGTKRD